VLVAVLAAVLAAAAQPPLQAGAAAHPNSQVAAAQPATRHGGVDQAGRPQRHAAFRKQGDL
jgi:hypothetical protein